MIHLHFNITDLRWAICLAGVVNSAKTGGNLKVNPPFTVSFEPSTPLMAHFASFYNKKPANAIDYVFPTTEQYPLIDQFSAVNFAINLEQQHGIRQKPVIVPLYNNNLIQNILLMKDKIIGKSEYYFPEFSKNEMTGIPDCDVLIEMSKYKDLALAFCKGSELPCKNIVSLEDVSELTAAKLTSTCKLFISRPYHPLQYIFRSRYKGFDRLAECPPILSVIDGTVKSNDRNLVSWNGQIPVLKQDQLRDIILRGKVWRTRLTYNFDHRKFYKENPNAMQTM